MFTKVKLGQNARDVIQKGVNAVYNPVRLTLGPCGQNALIYRTYNRGSRITNDGVTIAKTIEPKDEFENLVAKTFRESAEKTNEKAGDGTTTTIVLAGKLINDIMPTFDKGASFVKALGNNNVGGVMKLKKDLQESMRLVVDKIKEKSKPVDSLADLEKIAIVSVEDEEIGKIIAKMAWDVGVDGFIDTVEGYKGGIETEVIDGMRFPAKIAARAFVTNPERFEAVVEQMPVVVTNFAFDNPAQLRFCNAQSLETSKLAIFAPSFSESVLLELVKAFKQNFQIYPVAVPSLRTEQFEDLSVYVDATFINKDVGMKLDRISKLDLGYAEKLVVKDTDAKEDAAVIGGRGTKEKETEVSGVKLMVKSSVSDRIEMLKKQSLEQKEEIQKKHIERRIASMSSAVGIIRVGASTQAESLYKKHKIEDAVYACKAAIQEGYVKGGGLCLKEIAEELPESLLTSALKEPYNQIQENAEGGLEIAENIIDPAKVVRLEVEHAVSVASNLLTAGIIIPEEREMTQGEGEIELAKVVLTGVKFWAKHLGLIKENELEVEKDNLRRFESRIQNDNG